MTLKKIAERAGVSLATVSYALRHHPKIPLATRERVQAAARALGYRPNPRVAGLMAHIRRGRTRLAGDRLAFVWVHTSRTDAVRQPLLRAVFQGAQARAQQAGFGLEEFWTADAGMTDRRLQKIIRARGIVGVVLSPVTTPETHVTLDWDWSLFAAAVVGNVTWTPDLHHAGHHHFLGMRRCLEELAKLGCVRPAALLDEETHERAKRAWEGAFLAHHPQPRDARALLRIWPRDQRADHGAWLRGTGADALIVHPTSALDELGLRTLAGRRRLPTVTLNWQEERAGIGGIDQGHDRVAAHAVDLVTSQLQLNELGPPAFPRIMLFGGSWIPPQVNPRISKSSTKPGR